MNENKFIHKKRSYVEADGRRPVGRPAPGDQSSRRFQDIARYALKSPEQLLIQDLAGLHALTSGPGY
jgi:hypothetical protein